MAPLAPEDIEDRHHMADRLWQGVELPSSRAHLARSAVRANPHRHGFALRPHRQPPYRASAKMQALSKTNRGWSWLSVKLEEFRSNKISRPRKGDLPTELLEAIWGAPGSKSCRVAAESYRSFIESRSSQESEYLEREIKKIEARKRKHIISTKAPESLMDVLLQKWTYFDHAHEEMPEVENHVHAKYCENEFGHFLLPSGRQIHGQFNLPLHVLVNELRKVMAQLQTQMLETHYQELPSWKSPRQEELPELKIPPRPSMPQLYPIEGLLPIPSEKDANIPNDLLPPVFKSPIPKEYPPLILPEPLKIPALRLPVMPAIVDDESTIDYEFYKEEPLPVFVLPKPKSLPVWIEPSMAELPKEPEYMERDRLMPPVLETLNPFQPPLLDPRPCQKSYYELDEGELGICDGLCRKRGRKSYYKPGQQRKEPCIAKSPALLPLPSTPYSKAIMEVTNNKFLEEPIFEPPPIQESFPYFELPVPKKEPLYVPLPPLILPKWKDPPPPGPIGWLGRLRPVFLIDCSGAMAGERMLTVQRCFKALFSPDGQVGLAATHFDIIMYSFDAWSYGAIENSYLYKQASGSRNMKYLEPMRVNTPSTLEAALEWMERWRPAGTANLWKAMDVAINRTFADCIYLFSDGKPDKPVLILESLKKLAQMRGYSIPIHTIGLRTTRPGSRFLKRLSAATGGQFMDLDMNWNLKFPSPVDDSLQDIQWAQSLIGTYQKLNVECGGTETIKDFMRKAEAQFEKERLKPRIEAHAKKVKESEMLHEKQVQEIRKENTRALRRAKDAYERLIIGISERNRANLEAAGRSWKMKVEEVRQKNDQIAEDVKKWKLSVLDIQQQNELARKKNKDQFTMDLKEVEERNNLLMEKAKEDYLVEIEKLKKSNEDASTDYDRRQREVDEKVAAANKASRQAYEAALAAIRASNAELLSRTRLLYSEQVTLVKEENERLIHDAEVRYRQRCDDIVKENERRKTALAQRLEDIRRIREEAVAAHKVEVARAVAEHEEMIKRYSIMNQENEDKARKSWKIVGEQLDKENIEVAQKAMEAFEDEQKRVREFNLKLAERRVSLQRRIEEVERMNDELKKSKKMEWKEACLKAEEEYNEAVRRAKEEHAKESEFVALRNAERLQSSLLEHKAKVAAVESYNETLRPYVEASNAIRSEFQRIEAFLRSIADAILPLYQKSKQGQEQQQQQQPKNLEKDLDELLSTCEDASLNSGMLIEALQIAYGGKEKVINNQTTVQEPYSATEKRPQKGLSGLIPIHPDRVPAHCCIKVHDE